LFSSPQYQPHHLNGVAFRLDPGTADRNDEILPESLLSPDDNDPRPDPSGWI
jgi:hypothetical protein